MSEDWSAIATEVAEGLASVGDITQGQEGFTVVLTRPGGEPANPWDPPPDATQYTLTAIDYPYEVKDRDGTVIREDDRRLYLQAGVVDPRLSDTITVQGEEFQVLRVKPLQPAGIAVMHEVQLRK